MLQKQDFQLVPEEYLTAQHRLTHPNGTIAEIVAGNPRYAEGAYKFVREAFHYVIEMKKRLRRRLPNTGISPSELLEVLRTMTRIRCGCAAKRQLKSWGVISCRDFSEIVRNLGEVGLISLDPGYSEEEFRFGYNFDEAFPEY